MSTIRLSVLLAAAGFYAGCMHEPPAELVDARQAYQEAASGPAAQAAPADLHVAHEALEQAEKSFEDKPHSYETRDLAYVAQRTAQKADAVARISLDQQLTEQAKEDFTEVQTAIVQETREELVATKEAASAAKESEAAAKAEAAGTASKLAESEAARREADARTADALAALGSVREEQRGLVITLSGSVLFQSGEAMLLPEAQTRLDQVAAALMETKDRRLVIEGHTDAQGSDGYNLELSQRRAEAVRTYLVSRGYDATLVDARGMGEIRPIADNASPEGRANNRRVEIVVSK